VPGRGDRQRANEAKTTKAALDMTSFDDSDAGHTRGIDTSGGTDAAMKTEAFGTNRRNFFKSAALGSAAAAMYSTGSVFAPLAAYADDLSTLNCTANDVRIPGPAQILNEPCNCTGVFDAVVQFRVINNTGTMRYCVTVHPCPVTLPNGTVFAPADIVIGDVDAKSDKLYNVTIKDYPCGAGLLCFGAAGPEADGGFPKGAACPSGECCTTVSWDVNPGCPTRVLSSKCRHQQVCIQGRGSATLDCAPGTAGVQTTCAVSCGGTGTLRACTTNSAGLGPFTYELTAPGQTKQTFGPTADSCHDFNVGPLAATTTFTVTVTDKDNCAKSAQATLTVTPLSVQLGVTGGGSCNTGVLTFTATPLTAGCTYAFKVDGNVVQNLPANDAARNVYVYPADPDGACHTVSVVMTCGTGASACPSTPQSRTVSQCVQSTIGTGSCA
jgi:hypothetical protein